MNESAFFQDLAMLMIVAGIVSVIFGKLKWPKVLGYIGAGVFMNEYTWGGSFLADPDSVRIISQLGVVFLMFSMGLDFSTSQMKRIKSVSMPVSVIDTIVMVWIGYSVGHHCFGWGNVPSLFLGVAICDSATTMLAKVIDEMKWGEKTFVKYALGTSVCEDMICVGLIAIITGVANGNGLSLSVAGLSMGALFVFFLAVLVFGLILVPRLLTSVVKLHDDEALLLTILGCCFLVSWMAYKFDFSLAIGAFLVGILGASSDVREKLAELVSPLKNMFAAMFFVTIGLLMNPMACWHNIGPILIVTAVVVGGKFANCTLGSIIVGKSIKTSVQIGMSLAQIGEFAFMVAIMYLDLTKDYATPMYDIVIAVSVLSTLLNPMMIRFSVPFGAWIEDHLPSRSKKGLETYRGFVAKFQASESEVMIHKVIRNGFIELGVIGALICAVAIGFSFMEEYDWSNFSVWFNVHKRFAFCLMANLFIVAMLAPIIKIARRIGRSFGLVLIAGGNAKWQQAMRNIIELAVVIGVLLLLFFETSMVNVNLAPEEIWARWVIRVILLVAAVSGWQFFVKLSKRASTRFTEALGAEERRAKIGSMMTFSIPEERVKHLTLDLISPAIGETVVSLNVRAKTGANIVAIERDGVEIRTFLSNTELRAGDTVVAVGDGPQIAALKDLLGLTQSEWTQS